MASYKCRYCGRGLPLGQRWKPRPTFGWSGVRNSIVEKEPWQSLITNLSGTDRARERLPNRTSHARRCQLHLCSAISPPQRSAIVLHVWAFFRRSSTMSHNCVVSVVSAETCPSVSSTYDRLVRRIAWRSEGLRKCKPGASCWCALSMMSIC